MAKRGGGKTELVLLTKRHNPTIAEVRVGSETIKEKTIKYLGARLDTKLLYWAQIKYTAEKVSKATANSNLVARVGGQRETVNGGCEGGLTNVMKKRNTEI